MPNGTTDRSLDFYLPILLSYQSRISSLIFQN